VAARQTKSSPQPGLTIEDVLRSVAPRRAGARSWRSLAEWPPDVFAVTSSILEDSGTYRLIVSPPPECDWPPDPLWKDSVRETGLQWHASVRPHGRQQPPAWVRDYWDLLLKRREIALLELAESRRWSLFVAIATLHAMADEACAGLGIPVDADSNTPFAQAANQLLTTNGSMSRLEAERVRVLPKMRTPQVGATLRSLSMHAAIDRSELGVSWMANKHACKEGPERINLLLLPWPEHVRARDFREVRFDRERRFGFFEFDPDVALDVDRVDRLIGASRSLVGAVGGVILPEEAVRHIELPKLRAILDRHGVPILLSGVRGSRRNYAHLAASDGKRLHYEYDQSKHHRWVLDQSQIQQYHLGSALHLGHRWWEDVEIGPRCISVLCANSWLTITHLICEDLARTGPGVDLIRSVGPTLVIALLLDGPQLSSRWPGRYASVLAEDPGSSILTLTSLGMVERSRPAAAAPSRVIALWKDGETGVRELALDSQAHGLLLTLSAKWTEEMTADGRSDGESAARLVLGGVQSIVDPGPPKRAKARR
jgi:hypothetical protein